MHRPRYRCAINADLWRDSKCWLKAQIFYGLAETKENHKNKKKKGDAAGKQEKNSRKAGGNRKKRRKEETIRDSHATGVGPRFQHVPSRPADLAPCRQSRTGVAHHERLRGEVLPHSQCAAGQHYYAQYQD